MKALFRASLFAAFASLLLFYSCQKALRNDKQVPVENIPDESDKFVDEPVTANFKGRVVDEKGMPMASVKISVNTSVTYSDRYGVFSLSNAVVGKQFGLVKVEKPGYFTGFRTVVTRQSQMNFVEVKLQKKEIKGSFSAESAASVTIQDGTVVEFRIMQQ